MILSADQQRAVERTGQDVCVVAGPGSGKTRVLIERFAWLVEQRGVDPERILAITFTEKAATEIKQRLIGRFDARPDLRDRMERAWVSTIHGLCARLLRENAIAAGLPPDFTVLDQAPADRLARDAAEEALDTLFQQQPAAMRRLLETLDLSTQDDGRQPDLARSLLTVYESIRMSGSPVKDTRRDTPNPSGEVRALALIILGDPCTGNTANQRIAHTHLRDWAREFLALSPHSAIEDHFKLSRLIGVNVGHLVKDTPSRNSAASLKNDCLPRLECWLVEQSNAPQIAILRSAIDRVHYIYLEKKRAESALDFADLEEQAIRLLESGDAIRRETVARFDEILMDELQDTNRLQWRLIDLLRGKLFAVGDINQSVYSFRHAEPAVFHEYRSGLIAAGAQVDDLRENHRSLAGILSAVSRSLDGQPGIEPRPLIAARGAGAVVERLVARGPDAENIEAALVAARIRELVDSKQRNLRDIAILVRTLSSVEPFERALDRFDVPFLVAGGRTFLEAREIRDVMTLLAALVNPLDEISLFGALRGPLAGIADEELFRIGPEGWRDTFENLFGKLRARAGLAAPDLLLATALDECGYVEPLADRERANLEKFFALIRKQHTARPRPLAELLDDLESLRATQSEAEAPPSDAVNAVRLMSIHAAKGLEFPVVFVAAMHRRPDRRTPVITYSPERGIGAKWRNPVTGDGQSDPAHAYAKEQLKHREEAEENRLLYVAMTRARDRLILSYSERDRASTWQKLAESAAPSMIVADVAPEPPPLRAASIAESAAEMVLDKPALTGQYDSSTTVTAIATFQACPRRYLLSTIATSVWSGEGTGDGGIATGLAVHRILAGESSGSVEHAELAARFHASELGLRAQKASHIEREFDFMICIEDVVLRGQIDLWFEESGDLIVVDYKTDRDESSASRYALQLQLYALALERYAGRIPYRAALFYVRSSRTIEVNLAAESLAAAHAAVRRFRDAQDAGEFPLNAGVHCRRCEFFGTRCPGDGSVNTT